MEDNERNKKTPPKRAKRSSKKKTTSKKVTPKKSASKKEEPLKGDDLTQSFPLTIESLSAVLMTYEADPETIKSKNNIRFMSHKLQEYLSSYILIGYTLDGRPVNVTYAPTPQDLDALSTNLQRYIVEGGMHGNFPGGSDM
jgi:hypothetical protein